ncbi:MAG: Crp/Fnr family transcriptional regulator [Caldilineaceae bacterium]
MIRHVAEFDRFLQQLQQSLWQHADGLHTVTVAEGANADVDGDLGQTVFSIKCGQIKQVVFSAGGRECLLAIRTAGDLFGELYLTGLETRRETATAMTKTLLIPIPRSEFLVRLSRDLLLEGFVQYLALRVADQQEIMASLATVDSEQRLGATLLGLARKLGKQDPRSIRIKQRITHEEWAAMVGTTRPGITKFLQRWRELGLIELSTEEFLIIKETKLADYLAQIA